VVLLLVARLLLELELQPLPELRLEPVPPLMPMPRLVLKPMLGPLPVHLLVLMPIVEYLLELQLEPLVQLMAILAGQQLGLRRLAELAQQQQLEFLVIELELLDRRLLEQLLLARLNQLS